MKGYRPFKGLHAILMLKTRRSSILWLSLLSMLLIPALACNLPQRQVGGLGFPTGQAQVPSPGLPFPAEELTPAPGLTNLPTSTSPTLEPGGALDPAQGLQTAAPGAGLPGQGFTPAPGELLPPFTYISQSGDTLTALAGRFGVAPDQVIPLQPMTGFLQPGQQLTIPNLLGEPPYSSAALPDSIVINSPAAAAFKTADFIAQAGGYLSTYREQEDTGEWLTGSEIVQRVASESSINPQVLLAFLEFRSAWVRGQPVDPNQVDYPIGFYVPDYHGLYMELSLVAKELSLGYYGWRQGTLTELVFPSSTHVRISPGLNAGSVAVQNLTSKFYLRQQDWLGALYGPRGFLATYKQMFGDPWEAAGRFGPIFPLDLVQPVLELPFNPGEDWCLTSGPHIAWRTGTPRGALDFAPITGEPACAVSTSWVTASAPGLVVRSEAGIVTLDLDGDGLEQTGWVLLYMHVADQERVAPGTWVQVDTPLGHPSCEGGQATGTHVHLARKYNGEWLAADGPLPMVLSGWVAHAGELSYEGTLEKDGRIVSAHPDGSSGSTIIR
jgi:LasA protease